MPDLPALPPRLPDGVPGAPTVGAGSAGDGVFTPGAELSARVVETLDATHVTVQVRGRTLVAESPQPLVPGSVVKIAIAAVGDQITARLLPPDVATALPVGSADARQVAAQALVQSAFAEAGAPLDPVRVRVAVAAVMAVMQAIADDGHASSPAVRSGDVGRGLSAAPSDVSGAFAPSVSGASDGVAATVASIAPQRFAAAHAALARAGLPVTPALEALALRAGTPTVPDPASALATVRATVETAVRQGALPLVPSTAATVTAPPGAVAKTTPGAPLMVPAGASPAAAGISAAADVHAPASGVPVATVFASFPALVSASLPSLSVPSASLTSVSSQTTDGAAVAEKSEMSPATRSPTSPGTGEVIRATASSPLASPGVSSPVVVASLPAGSMPPSPTEPRVSPPPSSPAASPLAPAPPQSPLTVPSSSLASSPMPTEETPLHDVAASLTPMSAAMAGRPAVARAALAALAAYRGEPVVPNMPGTTPAPARVSPLVSPLILEAVPTIAWRSVLAEALPDAVRDGAPGVQRALALAGLRVSATDADAAPVRAHPSLLHHLASAAAEIDDASVRASGGAAALAPVTEAVVGAVREQAAATVFHDDSLRDYDRVLPVPLTVDGQPTPTRLAVARRSQPGGGTATYVRVDTELSELGPVSVRLSGLDGGAMAITLMADGAAAAVLSAALPALAADLRTAGLVAGLRVVDGSGHECGGASSGGEAP